MNIAVVMTEILSGEEMQKRHFLSNCGLVHKDELESGFPSARINRTQVCFIVLDVVSKNIPRSGRAFVCPEPNCYYFNRTLSLIDSHFYNNH